MLLNKTAYFLKVICSVILPNCFRPNGEQSTEICRTFSCDKFNQMVSSNINIWTNPCEDYYGYACSHVETSTNQIYNFIQKRNQINENIFYKFITGDNTNNASTVSNEESAIRFGIKKARTFHRSCEQMKNHTFPNAEILFIRRIMNEIGLPVQPPFNDFPSMKFNNAKTLAKLQTSGLLKQFFAFETDTMFVSQTGQTLPIIKTYPLRFIFPEFTAIATIIENVNNLTNAQLSESDQLNQLDRIHKVIKLFDEMENIYNRRFVPTADIERGLGPKIQSKLEYEFERTYKSTSEAIPEPRLNDSSEDKSVTLSLSEIQKISAKIFSEQASAMIRIDWFEYFNELLQDVPGAHQFNENSQIVIENAEEFKDILKVLASTHHEVFVATLWVIVMQAITLLFDSDRWPHVSLLQSDITREEFRRKFCLIATQQQFPEIVIYALNQTLDDSVRENIYAEIDMFVKNIKNSLLDTLNDASWLQYEPFNKLAVQEKIENLTYYIPFWKTSRSESDFSQLYDEKIIYPKAFHTTCTAILKNRLRKELAEIFNKKDEPRKLVPVTTNVLNADIIYHSRYNHLEISAGNIGYPLFGYGIKAIDLGILGFHIARQMVKAIAIQGKTPDKKWHETMTQDYYELIDCFAEKYTAFTNPTSKDYKWWETSLKEFPTHAIDGFSTAYSNLVDTIAYHIIDRTLIKYYPLAGDNKKIEKLPYLESRQLLTLSYATQYCYNDPKLKMPNPWKIRGTLIMNGDIFAETYDCKPTDRMIATDKCEPWL